MNILIVGCTGMLGHKLALLLADEFTVTGTVRKNANSYREHPVLAKIPLIGDVVAENFDSVTRAMAIARPQVVVNCIGIIKQQHAAKDPLPSISINSLFPHRLSHLCRAAGARLIHISTDCIFSGRKGNYTESDPPDAEDLYGRSKLLGEVDGPGSLTIRTSIIGRELESKYGLLEWFLSQEGKTVRGFQKAIFSGFTTHALARVIGDIIARHPNLEGVYQVSSEAISKFDLLALIKQCYGCDIHIEPDSTFHCDRSLNSERFRTATGFRPATWPEMIQEMSRDQTPYQDIARYHAHR